MTDRRAKRPEAADRQGHASGAAPRVVVVGAGVSGCACALSLADAGIPVLLLSSALDAVGLPAYGPAAEWPSVVASATPLHYVWERWGRTPGEGGEYLVVDRRAVSLATKELVESHPLVDIRQGLVIDARGARDGGVEIETAFGDLLHGIACVLAPGLALGGRVEVGEQTLDGGCYGEVAADGLYEALAGRGVGFRLVERRVGARYAGRPAGRWLGNTRAVPLEPSPGRYAPSRHPAGIAPSAGRTVPRGPHELAVDQATIAFVSNEKADSWSAPRKEAPAFGLYPDGAATGEWYLSPELEWDMSAAGMVVVRPRHVVRGWAIASAGPAARLGAQPLWVAGQAAGARSYAESLLSGVGVARNVADWWATERLPHVGTLPGARPVPPSVAKAGAAYRPEEGDEAHGPGDSSGGAPRSAGSVAGVRDADRSEGGFALPEGKGDREGRGELDYDVIVVGAGHAGCEAALAAARMGYRTAMVTLNVEKIALMPCNPAVGGVGKGQLTREVDALGGEQGRNTDRSFIQIKMLNTSKGPAVRALRAQADKRLYEDWMRHTVFRTPRLDVVQGEAASLDVSRETVRGLVLADGRRLSTRAVVLATGTFLRAKVVVGDRTYAAGRVGELPATRLSASLLSLGLELGRFQSATPPRIDGRTIDSTRMLSQPGEDGGLHFSHWEHPSPRTQVPCYLTYTTPHTHEVVVDHLHLSPLRSGSVSGRGPRYCPSIDRKVINFPDRERHPVFVEPEGARTFEMYLQGLTTSLPVHVQERIIRATPGLERARLIRPGYAVEYDYLVPQQLTLSLEAKSIRGLFSAGQINGTSGYEEAAAQGLMAGINAARYAAGEPPFVLRRDQAYIGVLIDDLVTKGVDEPYRMFTSRAEYRLLLRHDNADERLAALGHDLGLVSRAQLDQVEAKRRMVERGTEILASAYVRPGVEADALLESLGTAPLTEAQTAAQVLRRPQLTFEDVLRLLDRPQRELLSEFPPDVVEQLAVRAQYDGYIQRQLAEIRRHQATEGFTIPADVDFSGLEGITVEAKDKLARLRPQTLGQASRIAGVSPADVSVLMVHLHRRRAGG